MTAPTPNAALAYKVLDHIDALPQLWRQGAWIGEEECGTVACFAGWAVLLSGCKVEHGNFIEKVTAGPAELIGKSIPDAADILLGITTEMLSERDLGDPYDGLLTREELGERVAEIFGPRPVDWNKPLEPMMGVPASGCDCSHDGGHGLAPWPDRERGHAADCPAYGQPPAEAIPLNLCEEMTPPPCAIHSVSELSCEVCTAQRRAFYTALGRDIGEQAWRECAHRADYDSAAHHERECPYHRGEVDEFGRPRPDGAS